MIASGPSVYESVLRSMGDGVISLDRSGTIMTCNPAASEMLGLREEDIRGRGFAEVFVPVPGLDAFNEVVLDAILRHGKVGKQVVECEVDGHAKVLAVNTTYFDADDDGADPSDPAAASEASENSAIVAVFTDVTELRELQESERKLGAQVEEQYAELQSAYREMEESRQNLANTLRKVQTIRAVATVAVFAVFLLVVLFAFDDPSAALAEAIAGGPTTQDAAPPDATSTYVVRPMRQVTTVSVPSQLEAGRETPIISPFDGRISALHFQYGDQVEEGQLLVDLDDSAIRQTRNERFRRFFDARKQLSALEDWEHSPDMRNAQRSLNRVGQSLKKQEIQLSSTQYLFDQGVIPAIEYESAQESYANLQLDYEDGKQALEAVREQGSAELLGIARMEFEIASEQLEEVEDAITRSQVRAPVTGIVFEAAESGGGGRDGGESGGRLLAGGTVADGQALLVIADVSSLSAAGSVDESEITQLRVDQPVTAQLEAFPDIELEGRLTSVASQANDSSGGGGTVRYNIEAILDDVTPEQKERLRLGMTVDLRIVVAESQDALLVPFDAVQAAGRGWTVRLVDPDTGEVRTVPVETGETTSQSVAIISGVEVGDTLVRGG